MSVTCGAQKGPRGDAVTIASGGATSRSTSFACAEPDGALCPMLDIMTSTLPDVLWSAAVPSRKILYVSPVALEVFGLSGDSIQEQGIPFGGLACDQDQALLQHAWSQALRAGWFDAEYRIVTASGEIRWIHSRGRLVLDDANKPVRIDGISRDITERQNQLCKLSHLRRISAAIGRISRAISHVEKRQQLFDAVCRIAVEEGRFPIACLGIVDRAGERLIAMAHHGLDPLPSTNLELDTGGPEYTDISAVRAQLTRRPAYDNDITTKQPQDTIRHLAVRRGCRSVISLPIIVSDCVVAVISLFSQEPHFFDAQEIQLLEDFSGNISVAIGHFEQRERLKHLARYDLLTGLPNRALFQERLTQLVEYARRSGTQTVVAVIDISRFRSVNETFGWSAADLLLCEVAKRLRIVWPEPNFLARVSADSFAVILTRITEQHIPEIRAELEVLVNSVFKSTFLVNEVKIRIAATVGVAASPLDGVSAHELFRKAEAAQKIAQREGEHILFYRKEMSPDGENTLLLETRLRQAVEAEEFELHYQPKHTTATGRVSGVEALLRWRGEPYGTVPPAKFIPILESSGMILQVGAWVTRQALAEATRWVSAGERPLRIAVNITPRQLCQPDFVRQIAAAMEAVPEMYGRLDLEITESTIMRDLPESISKLKQLRGMGVRVAVDDFGTGYSSLGYLAQLPVDAIKIDRSFIASLAGNAHSMILVSSIISLAHALELKVTAEGVESEEQANLLRLLKCDELQGYFLSEPLPSASIATYLRSEGGARSTVSLLRVCDQI